MKTPIEILDEMIHEYDNIMYLSYVWNPEMEIDRRSKARLIEAKERIQKETWWISVEDRLPTYTGTFPEEYVMAYNWEKVFEVLFTEDTVWNIFWTDEESDWFYKDITHWMPLPLPPNN